jgi:riboflavin kinase/FMN adenylyltransferase
VLTFDPHPISLLAPGRTPPSLSTLDRKAELIARCGVDCLIAYPTDHALLQLDADDFFARVVRQELDARGMVEGPNFYFGRDRGGDVAGLAVLCRTHAMSLRVVQPVELNGAIVSSSAIRAQVSSGAVAAAVEMLGHPYQLAGVVEHGAQRGRELGFPTANLGGIRTLLPADGVYAAVCRVADTDHPAAIHIGTNPTFQDANRKVEAHLLDFSGDLYGQTLRVDLLARVRETRTFPDRELFLVQLRDDLAAVRRIVTAESRGTR